MSDNTKTELIKKENPVKRGIFLLLPYLLLVLGILLISIWGYFSLFKNNVFYKLAINNNDPATSYTLPSVAEDEFPAIAYETQWATLNVENWYLKDIPVFFGDNNAMLSQGAGHWIGSRFCGQNGKVVISAHVTTFFYEIEDCKIGTLITMDTIYGQYVYKVSDIVIFNRWDESYISSDTSKETLVLYTCYPRENGYHYKEKRIALICDKVSGKAWPQYE